MATKKKALQAAAGAAGGEPLAVEDVFATYVEATGAGTTTVNQGIDIAGEGGLWWGRIRNISGDPDGRHELHDTERGAGNYLRSDSSAAQVNSSFNKLSTFTSDGYTGWSGTNGYNVVSWTFRKAPRFFDVVTYTGDGASTRDIAHSLSLKPGVVLIKRTDTTANWVYTSRVNSGSYYLGGVTLNLNSIAAYGEVSGSPLAEGLVDYNNTNDSTFRVADGFNVNAVNASGGTYVAYLFAHDPLGPSGDGSDGLIACGSVTLDGSGQGDVNLGWEPQWVMYKRTDGAGNWIITDSMRGWTALPNQAGASLLANDTAVEGAYAPASYLNSSGFLISGSAGQSYVYIAIRRGPMRVPTSGTEVYAVDTAGANASANQKVFDSGFPIDLLFYKNKTSASSWYWKTRLLSGSTYLLSDTTSAEGSTTYVDQFDHMDGLYTSDPFDYTSWYGTSFRRAPGFFDVVAYAGDANTVQTIDHNLGVKPEFVIGRNRGGGSWYVATKIATTTYHEGILNNNGTLYSQDFSNSNSEYAGFTDTTFSVRQQLNSNGANHVVYLFASLDGISKVGTFQTAYQDLTVDCGFTTGARFVLVKRVGTGSTNWDSWNVFSFGLTAAADGFMKLDTTEDIQTDGNNLESHPSGFIVKNGGGLNFANGQECVFLAIA